MTTRPSARGDGLPAGLPPAPPRLPDPPAAWPATPAVPTPPLEGDAALRARQIDACSDAQRCWIACYGATRDATLLVPYAGRSLALYAALVHRRERHLVASVAGHHLPYPGDPADPAASVRVEGLRYFVAHATLPDATPTFLHMLRHARLDGPLVLALWARLAAAVPRLGDGMRDAAGAWTVDGEYTQRVLGALAAHPAFPPPLLPAVATLALDPVFGPGPGYPAGLEAVLAQLADAAHECAPWLLALDPAALAPLLHRCSPAWRTRLLTEVLPVLGEGAPGRPAASARGRR